MLAGELCRRYGEQGLPADTIWLKFGGFAGQSFGAWLARGMTFELYGLANDYVGKGLSGGKIIVRGLRENDVVIGNTTFYGAVAGEAYIRGRAGERFCIRNSGLNAVVEGVGDHACEYMTGGRVVVIGPTGRNFAAGMSGGIAYVYDQAGDFAGRCNQGMVALESLEPEDERTIIKLLNEHAALTGSRIAKQVLDDFGREKRRFVKVMPVEYRRLLLESAMDEEELDLLGVSDG
jgi:glutamate synthase domain-containing protein 3